MKKTFNIYIVFILSLMQLKAQQPTIGLLEIDTELISDGYFLFCPWISSEFYLINNCGEKVNSWTSDLPLELKMAYLDEEGNFLLLNGDVLTKYDWDNNKIWQFKSSNYGIEAHHDFEIMPNGNFIVIAREVVEYQEGVGLGFEDYSAVDSLMIIDGLYEFEPIDTDSFNLVWKWNFKDHLVQETIDSLNNYGVVEDSPRKLDVNFSDNPDIFDWMHCNGVNYNEELDQVIISSRHTSEIYIIDHSTSIEEAASSSGGIHGFGGDFLWRWGNENLMEQHDPNWIPADHPNGGMISVFNNIDGNPGENYSSIKIIDPPVDAQGKYQLDTLNQFFPREAFKVLSGEEHGIFSPIMSGAHSQLNGNYVICSGRFGDFYELTSEGQLVWKYHNPVFGEPLTQYNPAMASFTFNIKKYPKDFIGFEGKDLTPFGLVENVNSLSASCALNTDIDEKLDVELSVFPNPSNDKVFFQSDDPVAQVQIFALSGKRIALIENPVHFIDLNLENGSYLFQFKLKDQLVTRMVSITP